MSPALWSAANGGGGASARAAAMRQSLILMDMLMDMGFLLRGDWQWPAGPDGPPSIDAASWGARSARRRAGKAGARHGARDRPVRARRRHRLARGDDQDEARGGRGRREGAAAGERTERAVGPQRRRVLA